MSRSDPTAGDETDYRYNALNQRLSKTTGMFATIHIWDGGQIAFDAWTVYGYPYYKQYLQGHYQHGMVMFGSFTPNLLNSTGDAVAMINAFNLTSNNMSIGHYEAYGTALATAYANNPYGYRGYYTDTETGFAYLNARYYDPATQRFTQEDTYWGDNMQRNLYAYCSGNPVMYTDPSGHYRELSKYALDGMVIQKASSKHSTPAQKQAQAKDVAKTVSRQPTIVRAPAAKPVSGTVKPPPAVTSTPAATPTPVATATPAATPTDTLLDFPVKCEMDMKLFEGGEECRRNFGRRIQPRSDASTEHKGIDLGDVVNVFEEDPVFAIADGTVLAVGYDNRSGNFMHIEHQYNGFQIRSSYLHLFKNVKEKFPVGSEVKKGYQIGQVGNTGASTDPHLHFGISVKTNQFADFQKQGYDRLFYREEVWTHVDPLYFTYNFR
jgi:RHS repeat-associated protein